ncbi:MAG: carboxypeptidase regulatory-like domain-containing protein [Planctomycetes bacterium]|nr:carboxypeptidase regulatory-like domain-containing protein [Planctomycetota bacterium]
MYSDSNKKYDNINADNLADAVSDLEAQLNSNASGEPIVIILGANHSVGFVNKLSKQDTNRIVIASSDTEEVAYKGPLPPDETIRHGDYFVWELFKYSARGLSLKKCYEKAAAKIAEFTENENGNGLITTENGQIAKAVSAGNGQYFDYSAQHPLLDDNGDGAGTYGVLSSLSGEDGGRSADLFISAGTSTTPLELSEVTDVTTLEAKDPAPTLFAKVSDTTNVDEVWIEITSPNHSLTKTGTATEQQVINLPRFSYTDYDSDTEKYLWDEYQGNKKFQNFESAGKYGIFYFARDNDYGEITPFLASNVFRNKANVQKPGDFSYISPYAGEETAVGLMFDWEDAEGADTYTFQMSESSAFDTIKYEKKGLTDSIVVVDKTAGLRDGTTYYWTVVAINDGGITYMTASTGTTTARGSSKNAVTKTPSSFTPKLANGYPGFIKGFIFDKDTNTKISDATVSIQGAKGSYTTTDSGAYFLQLSSGDYTLSVDASGYGTTAQKITVSALSTTTENIGLTANTQPASISGKVKEQKKNKPLKEVTITIKKKTFTRTITTDSAGNYSVTDLESGRYTLTARKSGYKGYKKNIKLEAGKEKKLNIKLDKSGKKKVTAHPLP